MLGHKRQMGTLVLAAATLLFAPGRAAAQEQPAVLTGRVTGAAGEPLSSANVAIPELNLITYVDQEGRYRLTVPGARARSQRATVVARMIGYQSRNAIVTLAPGAAITQDFQLPQDPLRLEEVVITGAGTEALAERLGTARASVSSQQIQRTNEPNVVTALAGKVPGVLTTQAAGDAGASTAIQIRGAKTFGTSQPTIIVDGVIINNATRSAGITGILQGAPSQNRAMDINPEDIESIEILKGAAATSIYGAAAGSAGAIMITTKRGRTGRTEYTLRSTVQADEPIRTVPMQRIYGVGTLGNSTACTTVNCAISAGFFSFGPALAPGTKTYDHGAEIYETGLMLDNTLSMSGGSERTTFYLSLGALDHDGFVVSDKDFIKRYTVRLNGSHALTDNLTVGAAGAYVQTRGAGIDRGNAINGLTLNAQRQPPEFNAQQYLDPVTGLHRSWRFPNPGPNSAIGTGAFNRGFDNPFYAINEHSLTSETGRYFGNINAQYQPFTWLSANWTLGGDYNSDDRMNAFAQAGSGLAGGQVERWQFYDRILDHNLSVTGTRALTSDITGTLTLGQNLNETYFRQVYVVGQTLIAPKPFKLANTTTRQVPSDAESRRRVEGYFAQANADLYDQLFLQARIRSDGNSAFGVGKQRAMYPGANAAWSFTKALDVSPSLLSFGKLRIAYGESGQQPPLYVTQDVFTTASFADFNPASLQVPTLNGIGGLYAGATRGNPDIEPERVQELEMGFDLSFFNGSADLSLTRYDSKSKDVIFGVPLPPSTGYTNVNLNAGELTNKGWEITANYRPIQKRDLSIELGANWGQNKNLVTSLGKIDAQTCTSADVTQCAFGTVQIPTAEFCTAAAVLPRCVTGLGSSFSGQTTHAQVGFPLGVWRSVDFARCGISGNSVTYSGTTYDVGTACAGKPYGALYLAPNGFPIQDGTVRAIGNPWPDWTAGFSGYVNFKGIEVSAFVDHRHGGDVLNMTRSSMYQYGTHKDTEIRGQQRRFGDNMLCHNQTCDVINGPVVGPGVDATTGVGIPVVIGEGWFSSGAAGPGGGLGATAGPISTRLEDATHTRLREVSVGYTFSQPWVQRVAGMRSMDVKFSGRNLGLWAVYSGLDPEVNLGGAQNSNRGIDFFMTPLTRAWVLSVALHH